MTKSCNFDCDWEIIKNLIVNHPIQSDFKKWWQSRLFVKKWLQSLMDNHRHVWFIQSMRVTKILNVTFGANYFLKHTVWGLIYTQFIKPTKIINVNLVHWWFECWLRFTKWTGWTDAKSIIWHVFVVWNHTEKKKLNGGLQI